MSWWNAIILGLVQGLTEFLPVSSSGHLVISQHLLGMQEPPLTFDAMLHLGTLVAVFVFFWDDIVAILRRPFSRLTLLIVIGCIPAAILGIWLQPVFEKAFESLLVVGIGLVFTGFLLRLGEKVASQDLRFKDWKSTTVKDALFIGIMQGIAITPGISRSGSTIAGSLLCGMKRDYAARFSFLLSIPVILGAGLIQILDMPAGGLTDGKWMIYSLGVVVAAISGYIAIKIVISLLKRGKLSVFSYYCWGVGTLSLIGYLLAR